MSLAYPTRLSSLKGEEKNVNNNFLIHSTMKTRHRGARKTESYTN